MVLCGFDKLPILDRIVQWFTKTIPDSITMYTSAGLSAPRVVPTEITIITLS